MRGCGRYRLYDALLCYVHCSVICSVLLVAVPLNRCRLWECAPSSAGKRMAVTLPQFAHGASQTDHAVHIIMHTSIGQANASKACVGVLLCVCSREAQAQLVRTIDHLQQRNTPDFEQHIFVLLCASERHDASRLSELYEVFHTTGRLANRNLSRTPTRTILAVLLVANSFYDTDALNAALSTRHALLTGCDYFLRLSTGVSPQTQWAQAMIQRLKLNSNVGFVSGSCTLLGRRVVALVPAVARRTTCNELFHREHIVANQLAFPVHTRDTHIHHYLQHLYAEQWHINNRWRRILTDVVFVERLVPASVFDDFFRHSASARSNLTVQ